MGGKVNCQLPFMCGRCKHTFETRKGVADHIRTAHQGNCVGIYQRVNLIDLREPSLADLVVDAQSEGRTGDEIPW
jgi:hypothetical protein